MSQDFIDELSRQNVSVWDRAAQGSGGVWRPIPVAMEPVIVEKSSWDRLVADARVVLSAFPVVLAWLQRPENVQLFQRLFGHLSGIEAEAAAAPPEKNWGHATLRFDLFWQDDELKIIEANCTIPAMQAYSDMVRDSWRAGSSSGGSTGSNSGDLLESLLALYQIHGGTKSRPRIAIVHREGDSQLAELNHFEQRWGQKFQTVRVTPETFAREPADLYYRHIFAHKVDAYPEIVTSLRDWRKARFFNPVSAHYEVKGFLAVLSAIAGDDALAASAGLSAEQRRAINDRVPWTRLLPCERDTGEILRNMDQYVFKSSSGYGGHAVFIGSEWGSERGDTSTQARLRALMRSNDPVTPKDFLAWIAASPGVWVIQQRVSGRRHKSKVITSSRDVIEVDGFVDASVFLNSGAPPLCGGGVSRFAAGPLVNIGTGGGLAPFAVI